MANSNHTFVDLFSGIGGFRLALEGCGFECLFSSEIDKFARETYIANFGAKNLFGDIRESKSFIPRADLLTAGFPCQPFSLAGVSKRNSLRRAHGFDDKESGNLFFEIESVIRATRPKAFLLENVRNLKSHDKGKTFSYMMKVLEEDLGYFVHHQIIDAAYFLPQHRERIFIVGFKKKTKFSFDNLCFPKKPKTLKSVLFPNSDVESKYTLSDDLWEYLKRYSEKHRRAGNGFGFGIVDRDRDLITRTLSARYHKDGSEILVRQRGGMNPRRLTPKECSSLMGFPKGFKIPVSDTQAYKQFGNSVAVPVISAIVCELKKYL